MRGAYSKQKLNRRWKHFHPEFVGAINFLYPRQTVSDFGAGIGLYVLGLATSGHYTLGYDGTPNIEEASNGLVQCVDLASRQDLPATQVVISIEVGEHIPPENFDVFIDNLCRHATSRIVLSWATRGQRGKNHVNCLNPDELIEPFAARDWSLNVTETKTFRENVPAPYNQKVLVFSREPSHEAKTTAAQLEWVRDSSNGLE